MANPLASKGKIRNVPSFDDVGTTPEVNLESNSNANTDTGTNTGIDINAILPPETKVIKKQVSVYLDPDVIQALNRFGNERGKGAKSDLINNFLKQVFNIRQ